MKSKSFNKSSFSRRKILPILCGSLLFPFFGFINSDNKSTSEVNNEEYQTLLKSDGTIVKVKVSTIRKAKIIQKNISNKSLLNWLKRKL